MKIRIEIDSSLKDEMVIKCREVNNDVKEIINLINKEKKILVKQDKENRFININDIFRVDTVDDRIFIYTENEMYETEYRIYELDKLLPSDRFVRVNKAAIINIFKIEKLKTDINRRIKITLINGDKEIVNRTYISKFKDLMNEMKRRILNEKNL